MIAAAQDGCLVVYCSPQCSVVGPLLFLVYVNDFPEWIWNSIHMFADETKTWAVVRCTNDDV